MSVMKGSGCVGAVSRIGIAGALGVLAGFAGGCTVGSGSGSVSGDIYVLGCFPNGGSYAEAVDAGVAATRFFDLQPTFFAGEPTEEPGSVVVQQPANLLTIRLQRNGNRIEINDTLYFDVLNSYEVARCVRGQTKNGVPQWDQRMTTDFKTELPTKTPWCDWSGTAQIGDGGASDGGASDGGDAGAVAVPVGERHAVIHLTTEDMVHSSLSLLFTCHKADVVAVAFDGTIEFQDFGSAAQNNVPSDMRGMIPSDFKINFGDRLRAKFRVVLDDERIWGATKLLMPVPLPRMGGEVSGYFDFDLERGRAAQPFP